VLAPPRKLHRAIRYPTPGAGKRSTVAGASSSKPREGERGEPGSDSPRLGTFSHLEVRLLPVAFGIVLDRACIVCQDRACIVCQAVLGVPLPLCWGRFEEWPGGLDGRSAPLGGGSRSRAGEVTERLLRTRDVAELLDVSCETVLRWHRSGKLPGGRRLGCNVLRFSEPEIEAWIEGTRSEPLVSVASGSYDRGAE
jgi:excisionase family DNA binding protein